jgi:hypothetical protein
MNLLGAAEGFVVHPAFEWVMWGMIACCDA